VGTLTLIRVIPVVVVENGKAFHMIKFKKSQYLGDPINICRIFSEKNCDELVILDVSTSHNNTLLGSGGLEKLTENIFVPISYGGGIRNENDIRGAFSSGVEKIVVKYGSKSFIEVAQKCSQIFGAQSVILNLNVTTKRILSNYINRYILLDTLALKLSLIDSDFFGEVLVQLVENIGTYSGISEIAAKHIVEAINKPVIYSGGVRNVDDIFKLSKCGAGGVAISSLFSLHEITRTPLISYLDEETRLQIGEM
jgi:cyclase